ncbi:MAG: asparagine synthase (glutamine-hydrolyzing) [Bacteroidota bacterium]
MCGIAGILDFNSNEQSIAARLKIMSDTLKHRGPNDEGFAFFNETESFIYGANDTQPESWNNAFAYSPKNHIDNFSEDVFLGIAHRRLSVIDLSAAGHQPMCNADKSIWIACNGEIYNYIELREELEEKGMTFRTKSDIEVLLKAYEYWGLRFLDKLNGMWSFVIFNRKENFLIACRDRFGVKPFYYYHQNNMLAFASEQKALYTLPLDTAINHQAVYNYLVQSKVEIDENGFYHNVKELLPSHYFIYDLNTRQFRVNRYYQLSVNPSAEKFNELKSREMIEQTRQKIVSSVELRLRSDVPVGFCLSGGIDSSSIIGVAKHINDSRHLKQLQGNLHAFTATHPNQACDESKWAEQVVTKNNLNWHKTECSAAQLFDELQTIIYYQDAPLFSTSTYAQNAVMKKAKQEGITILLDGQGADELFAGYVPFYISFYIGLIKKFRLGNLASECMNLKHAPLNASVLFKSLLKVALNESLSESAKNSLYKKTHNETSFLSADFLKQNNSNLSMAQDYSSKNMNRLLHDFFTHNYLKNLLRWEDRCSMQYSIESRTPFADDINLIESVFSMPAAYKIHKGWSKYLLRNAMKDVLPQSIYRRTDKLGFATPQTFWLMNENKRMKSIIQDLQHYDTDNIVDTQKIFYNWQRIFSTIANKSSQDFVWRYLNYLIWRKTNQNGVSLPI